MPSRIKFKWGIFALLTVIALVASCNRVQGQTIEVISVNVMDRVVLDSGKISGKFVVAQKEERMVVYTTYVTPKTPRSPSIDSLIDVHLAKTGQKPLKASRQKITAYESTPVETKWIIVFLALSPTNAMERLDKRNFPGVEYTRTLKKGLWIYHSIPWVGNDRMEAYKALQEDLKTVQQNYPDAYITKL